MAEHQPITARQQPDFSNVRHAKTVASRRITALADWHWQSSRSLAPLSATASPPPSAETLMAGESPLRSGVFCHARPPLRSALLDFCH